MLFHFLNHLLTHLRRLKAKKTVRIAGLGSGMRRAFRVSKVEVGRLVHSSLRETPFGRRNHHALSELKKPFLET